MPLLLYTKVIRIAIIPAENDKSGTRDRFRFVLSCRMYRCYAMVCRISFPLTMKITISAMLVAWSAIRSSDFEM